MKFRLSNHALEEMERRGIPREMLERVLDSPQQVVVEREGKKAYQSQIDFGGGRIYLLRAKVLEAPMKVTYDQEVDVLRIVLSNAAIEESDEDKPGVILDYDVSGNVVGIEILDASKRMENPRSVEYAVAG